jgi:Major Facilitator Superfamily
VLFPFVAFMVEDLGYGGSQLGYYAGGLAASFCGAQFCSSILWGMFSDKYGRKPAIGIGTLGAAVGMLIFGSATNYTYALLGRILSGLLSGNLGVLKSFLTEITDESNRGAGFSYMSVAWALGTIIAPLAGGLLCNPADKYPRYFKKSGIFGVYPYLLPCVICVVFNVVSACMCQLYMVETRNPKGQLAISNAEAKYGNCCRLCPLLGMSTEKQEKLDVAKFEMESSSLSHSTGSKLSGGFIKRNLMTLVEGLESTKSFILRSLNIGGAVSHSNIRYDAVEADCSADEMNTTRMECEDDIDDENFESHSFVEGADVRSGDEVEMSLMETGKSSTDHSTSKTPASIGSANEFQLTSLSDCDTSDEETDFDVEKNEDDEEEEEELCYCCRNTSTTRRIEEATPIKFGSPLSSPGALSPGDDGFGDLSTVESTNSSTDDWQSDTTRDVKTFQKKNVKKSLKNQNVLKRRSVVLVTCNYGLLAMAFILWEETIPLFLKLNSSQGGFGLLSSDIGLLLSSSGGVMLVFTYLALPSLARRSKKWLFRLGICSAIPITFAIPVLATAKAMNPEIFQTKQGHFVLWMLLILCCVLKNISACISFTA